MQRGSILNAAVQKLIAGNNIPGKGHASMCCTPLKCNLHTNAVELTHFQGRFTTHSAPASTPCKLCASCSTAGGAPTGVTVITASLTTTEEPPLADRTSCLGSVYAGTQGHCCQCQKHTHRHTSTGMQCPQNTRCCFNCQQRIAQLPALHLTEKDCSASTQASR